MDNVWLIPQLLLAVPPIMGMDVQDNPEPNQPDHPDDIDQDYQNDSGLKPRCPKPEPNQPDQGHCEQACQEDSGFKQRFQKPPETKQSLQMQNGSITKGCHIDQDHQKTVAAHQTHIGTQKTHSEQDYQQDSGFKQQITTPSDSERQPRMSSEQPETKLSLRNGSIAARSEQDYQQDSGFKQQTTTLSDSERQERMASEQPETKLSLRNGSIAARSEQDYQQDSGFKQQTISSSDSERPEQTETKQSLLTQNDDYNIVRRYTGRAVAQYEHEDLLGFDEIQSVVPVTRNIPCHNGLQLLMPKSISMEQSQMPSYTIISQCGYKFLVTKQSNQTQKSAYDRNGQNTEETIIDLMKQSNATQESAYDRFGQNTQTSKPPELLTADIVTRSIEMRIPGRRDPLVALLA